MRMIARLNETDLARWREIFARDEAFRCNPDKFSKEESIAVIRERMEFLGEIAERYEIDPSGEWYVSAATGVIQIEI